jgi:hypothetical protein
MMQAKAVMNALQQNSTQILIAFDYGSFQSGFSRSGSG